MIKVNRLFFVLKRGKKHIYSSDVPIIIKNPPAVLSGSPSLCLDCHFVLKCTTVFRPAVWTRLLFILCPCVSKPPVLLSQTSSSWNCCPCHSASFFNVCYKVFIHAAHACTTMPYLEVMHKRIRRSRRNAFVKWIISDWQGFCQIVDTPSISFKCWFTVFGTKCELGLKEQAVLQIWQFSLMKFIKKKYKAIGKEAGN